MSKNHAKCYRTALIKEYNSEILSPVIDHWSVCLSSPDGVFALSLSAAGLHSLLLALLAERPQSGWHTRNETALQDSNVLRLLIWFLFRQSLTRWTTRSPALLAFCCGYPHPSTYSICRSPPQSDQHPISTLSHINADLSLAR